MEKISFHATRIKIPSSTIGIHLFPKFKFLPTKTRERIDEKRGGRLNKKTSWTIIFMARALLSRQRRVEKASRLLLVLGRGRVLSVEPVSRSLIEGKISFVIVVTGLSVCLVVCPRSILSPPIDISRWLDPSSFLLSFPPFFFLFVSNFLSSDTTHRFSSSLQDESREMYEWDREARSFVQEFYGNIRLEW